VSTPTRLQRSIIAALLLACSLGGSALTSGGALAQPPAAGDAMIRQDARTKVADHVWVILDENRAFVPNVGLVVGTKATLIIDTGLGRGNGSAQSREFSCTCQKTMRCLTSMTRMH